jgi:hypothetical protein
MSKNYARESGTFLALAKMFSDAVKELNDAQDSYDRKWATQRLNMLSEQTDATLVELGYKTKETV